MGFTATARGHSNDRRPRYSPTTSRPSSSLAADSLDPFAMRPAFPSSDYYGSSAPSRRHQPTTSLPTAAPKGDRQGGSGTVPTFTTLRSTGSAPSSSPAASPRV